MMACLPQVELRNFFEEGKYATWDWKKDRSELKRLHMATYGNEAAADKFVTEFVCAVNEGKYGTP